MLFQNKVALVTGAGSGIGAATALAFAREGARGLVLAGRRPDKLEEVARQVGALGTKALVVPVDVGQADQVAALLSAACDEFGTLDAAFNNAGIEGAFGPITDLGEDDFDATIAINLKGAWLCCREEIRAMARAGAGGAIVNNASWLACGALFGSSIYSASKAALEGMTRALALEAAQDGIRVNAVNPGIIDTPMLRRFGDQSTFEPFIQHTPVRRLGAAEEVAEAVVWLCSGAARFVTGQSIFVDGGYTIAGHRTWASRDVGRPQASASPTA